MSTAAQKICIDALSLPVESRAEIAERLLASLEEKADAKAAKAWKRLVRQRSEEVQSGMTKLRPADEVMRRALKAVS